MERTYNYPHQELLNVVEGIPLEDLAGYPKHLYEPERLEIARELALKEYYKLFPFLTPQAFDQMGQSMVQWVDGRDSQMAPLHDYWNFVGGTLTALKLKNIIPHLTSENIHWQLESIDVQKISLYWAVGTLSKFGDTHQSFDYDFVKRHILDDPNEKLENQRISDEKAADTVVDRDKFPIITRRGLDGNIKLIDGNRRVMRAWLSGSSTIESWVGSTIREPEVVNHWVGSDLLRRIVFEYINNPTDQAFTATRSQLDILFQSSVVAKYHFKERCMHIDGAKRLVADLSTFNT